MAKEHRRVKVILPEGYDPTPDVQLDNLAWQPIYTLSDIKLLIAKDARTKEMQVVVSLFGAFDLKEVCTNPAIRAWVLDKTSDLQKKFQVLISSLINNAFIPYPYEVCMNGRGLMAMKDALE